MKVLIYSDVHISQDSSIVKTFGEKFSTRLEHIIKSLNWAEQLADEKGCQAIFNLGDTFDKPVINPMEATAIQDVVWSKLPHYILVGNHDSNVASLEYSSVAVLKNLGFNIITEKLNLNLGGTSFTFIPYVTNDNRKPLSEYLISSEDIVLSHNDIAGFNYGMFVSKEGFDIEEVKTGCKLFLNGHLHNSSFLDKNVLNVGNLCGQNFSEDAFKYKHGCWILDTETTSLEFYENPFSLNFYKFEYDGDKDIFTKLKQNSVLMVKCDRKFNGEVKEELEKIKDKVVAVRILLYDKDVTTTIDTTIKLEKVDHLKQFTDFIHERLGNTELVNSELSEVCK